MSEVRSFCVLAAARGIGLHMNEYRLVVNKSTVPVGSAAKAGSAVRAATSETGEGDRCRARPEASPFLAIG